ncbi:MAG: transcription termination/antitermination protein NusG [Deltaproteobacteria bacterium]|nr:transcription termination/antitermination protein NusG [Deltaproteobacteria bacterium]
MNEENKKLEESGVENQQEETPVSSQPQPEILKNENLKWYVVHTYSGFESQAKQALQEKIKNGAFEKSFGDILVPIEESEKLVKGKKRKTSRKFFPGYMIVQMELNEATWHLVKATPKVTGFVGGLQNPTPVSEKEIQLIRDQMSGEVALSTLETSFQEGENVRVVEGPFANFNGVIEEVKPDKQKVKVLVSIFGRSTPVELSYSQVEKA